MRIFILLLCLSQAGLSQSLKVTKHNINWTGYGAIGNYSLQGSLQLKNGFMQLSADKEPAKGTLVFDMKTIVHTNAKLVKHLKGKDFFEVKKYPTATFKIMNVTPNFLVGRLTVKGITQPVEVPYTWTKNEKGYLLKGQTKVNRTKFNINYNSESFFKNLGSNAIKDEFLLTFSVNYQ